MLNYIYTQYKSCERIALEAVINIVVSGDRVYYYLLFKLYGEQWWRSSAACVAAL